MSINMGIMEVGLIFVDVENYHFSTYTLYLHH